MQKVLQVRSCTAQWQLLKLRHSVSHVLASVPPMGLNELSIVVVATPRDPTTVPQPRAVGGAQVPTPTQ